MTNPNTTSKDLGLAAAMIPGANPPTNTDVLWLDTTTSPGVKKYYDPTIGEWVPLIDDQNNNKFSVLLGKQVLFVSKSGNDYIAAVGDISHTFKNINTAYNFAKSINPSGINQIAIVIYPGTYQEDVTMDTPYISLMAAIPQNMIYNEDIFKNFNGNNKIVNFSLMRRKCIIDGTLIVATTAAEVKGIDCRYIKVKPYFANSTDRPDMRFENIVTQTISATAPGGDLTGEWIDVHAEVFFANDGQTNMSGTFKFTGANEFRRGTSIFNNNEWLGATRNADFENCYGGFNSFGSGGYVGDSKYHKCNFSTNCFNIVENVDFKFILAGNNFINKAISSTFNYLQAGTNCIKDFIDSVFQDCSLGEGFGVGGSEVFISGNLDNVTSDYTNGFAQGRQFWGKMRRMFIRTTNPAMPCLNMCTPQDGGTDRQPSSLEISTFLHCAPTPGDTVIGTVAYVSYCKFNVPYTLTNVLGSDNQSNNIVNENLCNYVPIICQAPSLFNLVTVNYITGTPINFVLNYQMPVSRAGSQIEMTRPNGTIQVYNFPGNDGGAGSGTKTINEPTPVAGTYKFRLRTVCQYDENNVPSHASAWSAYANANVTNQTRPTAWRAKESTKTCVVQTNTPVGVIGGVAMANLTSETTHPTTGVWFDYKRASIRVNFTDGSTSVNLNGKSFRVVIKERKKSLDYWYIGGSTTAFAIWWLTTENMMGSPYYYNNYAGTTFVDVENNRLYWERKYETTTGTDFGTQRDVYHNICEYDFLPLNENQIKGGNTGFKQWSVLEQYYTDNEALTGQTKPNVSSDDDYQPPVQDESYETGCPTGTATIDVEISNNDGMRIRKLEINRVLGPTNVAPKMPEWYVTTGTGAPYYNIPANLTSPHKFKIPDGVVMNIQCRIEIFGSSPVTNPGKVTIKVHEASGVQTFTPASNVDSFVGTFLNVTKIQIIR